MEPVNVNPESPLNPFKPDPPKNAPSTPYIKPKPSIQTFAKQYNANGGGVTRQDDSKVRDEIGVDSNAVYNPYTPTS